MTQCTKRNWLLNNVYWNQHNKDNREGIVGCTGQALYYRPAFRWTIIGVKVPGESRPLALECRPGLPNQHKYRRKRTHLAVPRLRTLKSRVVQWWSTPATLLTPCKGQGMRGTLFSLHALTSALWTTMLRWPGRVPVTRWSDAFPWPAVQMGYTLHASVAQSTIVSVELKKLARKLDQRWHKQPVAMFVTPAPLWRTKEQTHLHCNNAM